MKKFLTSFSDFLNENSGIPEELLDDPLMFTLSKMRRDQGITLVKPEKMQMSESVGGAFSGLLYNIKDYIINIIPDSTEVSPNDMKPALKKLKELEDVLYKTLKGKGLSGW